jgi:hypothetical protein
MSPPAPAESPSEAPANVPLATTGVAASSRPAAQGAIRDGTGPAAAAPAGPQAPAARLAKAESPERWLERIAELRSLGRDREADEALAEFRKRHPDYVIPQPMLDRVKAR